MTTLHIALSANGQPPDLTSVINVPMPDGIDGTYALLAALTSAAFEGIVLELMPVEQDAVERISDALEAKRGHVPA